MLALNKLISFLLITTLMHTVAMLPAHGSQKPQIRETLRKGSAVTLVGQYFGKKCGACEVIADYNGFRYSLPIKKWDATEIVSIVPDLGKGEDVNLVVVSSKGRSNVSKIKIKPVLVNSNQKKNAKMLSRSYDLSIGGKGVDKFDVNQPISKCGVEGLAFASAKVLLGKRTRFGDARIISTPRPGCQKCLPVKIGYYWEPTGKLQYRVKVNFKKIVGVCPERVRR